MRDVLAEWRFVNTNVGVGHVRGPYEGSFCTVMCSGTTTSGNVSGSVTLYGAHVDAPDVWDSLATFTLSSGTSPQSDKASFSTAYPYLKAECTAISGTGAKIILRMQRA